MKNIKREIAVNPIVEIRNNGEQVCRQKLQALELENIRFIIREHDYDPFKLLTKSQKNNKEYLIDFLINRATNLSKLGQCFRNSSKDTEINL